MKAHKRPLNRSITIGCVLFIVLLCVLLSFANLMLYRDYVYNDYRGYIEDILDYTLANIDGDDLAVCIDTLQGSERYKASLRFMDQIMDHFEDVHYFYAVKPLNTNDTGNTLSVLSAERYYDRYVDTEGNLYLGWISDDEFDAATAAQFFEIMNSDSIIYFEERTEWGADYTGAVAIRDSRGEAVAVLAADIDISFINNMILRFAGMNVLIISLTGCGFIALFLLWSRRNITLPIRELERSAVGFAGRSHGQRNVDALVFEAPRMPADNEIKSLSEAVVKMTEDMRDYVSGIINAEETAASMRELASRDALTGVRNKTAYDSETAQLNAKIRIGFYDIGLAVIDLNFLKKINDTYGHDKGNIAIRKLSKTVCGVFSVSSLFRIGGDEFVVVLRGHDLTHCDQLVKHLNDALAEMALDETLAPWEKISAAIGVAVYDKTLDTDMDSLFKRADAAMYQRKLEMKAQRQS